MLQYDIGNRSQQLLFLQNDFYHSKNKREARPHIKTNLTFRGGRASFREQHRVVHRNKAFEEREKQRISEENRGQLLRLLESKCQVPEVDKLDHHFKKFNNYKKIRCIFGDEGRRKNKAVISRYQLCPPDFKGFLRDSKKAMSVYSSSNCRCGRSRVVKSSCESRRSCGEGECLMMSDSLKWKQLGCSGLGSTGLSNSAAFSAFQLS